MRFVIFLVAVAAALGADAAERVQVQGHRGARAVLPENTLPAFQYAIEQGADVIELDLGVTRDGVVVVSHDPVLHPPICDGPNPGTAIRQLTLAEVRQWDCGALQNPAFPRQRPVPGTPLPTLDEVLALAPRGDFLFNLEIKISATTPEMAPEPEEFVRLVLEQIRKHGVESRVIVQSFDFRVLHEMKRQAPQIRLAALYTGESRDFVEIAREAGAGIVSPEFHMVTAERVRAAHAAGLDVVPWTVNEPADWDRLISAGVDGIITDDPAGLIEHLR